MDEKREERQKESIDEILSDLNGLLNKMPAILDGIKLSDVKPAAFPSPQLPEPDAPAITPAARLKITSEPASESAAPAPEPMKLPEPGAAVTDNGSAGPHPSEPPGGIAGAKEDGAGMESKRQPPEEDIFDSAIKQEESRQPDAVTPDENSKSYPLEPAGLNSAPELPEIKPVAGEIAPDNALRAPDGMAFELQPPETAKNHVCDPGSPSEDDAGAAFEGTRDFGVPDIDALIKLSQEKQTGPEPVTDRKDEPPAQPEPVPGQILETAAVPEAEPQPALEPVLGNTEIAPPAASAAGEGGVMDVKEENSGKEEPAKPVDAMEATLPGQVESVKQEPPVPAPGAADAGSQIERSSPQEFTLKGSEPEAPGLVIERTSSAFNSNTSAAAPGSDDKTMVLAPSSARPEDEKTVIYEAGANPGLASRGPADLGSLADKPVPDGIPSDHVRTVAFLYAQEDAGLCADMLAELDAICLKSPSTPMFIKRGFVMVCAPGVSGTVYMQKVADAGAVGMVCMGNIPQENIYEIENVFTAGGVFFKHFLREGFNHSAALDLVMEFILK